MVNEIKKKDVAERWFNALWGENPNLFVFEKLCSEDIRFQYSMNNIKIGYYEIMMFIVNFRDAFPDLKFKILSDLVDDRGVVVFKWEAFGTHTGRAFFDFNIGPFQENSRRKINLVGQCALRIMEEKVIEVAVWIHGNKVKLHCIDGGGGGVIVKRNEYF